MKIFTCLAILFFTANLFSQSVSQSIKDLLDSELENHTKGKAPGLAVGIVQNGAVIYEAYRGYANLDHGNKISGHTRFNIASNAKQFTAICVLTLIEEGYIMLEDDIKKYIPELFEKNNYHITIANLLTHTSGIRDVYELWSLQGKTWWQLFVGNDDALELLYSQTDLNFEPGTSYLYSNSNYIILTKIIERVSGKSFSAYADEVFKALGMNETSFMTNYMTVLPNRARSYGNWDGWKEYPSITEIHGDGGLFTTLADQLQWEKFLQTKEANKLAEKLMNKSQLQLPDSDTDEYGYGIMFDTYKNVPYRYHDGSTGAYGATFLRFPDENIAILVLSNSGSVPTHYVAKKLTDILLELNSSIAEYPAGPEKIGTMDTIESLVGDYKTESGTIIKIVERDNELYREIKDRDPVRLIQEEGSLFHYESNTDLKINFTKDEDGNQLFTIYLSSQAPNVGIRLPDFKLNNDYWDEMEGTFYNNETETEISIAHLQNNICSVTKNGKQREAKLLYKDHLQMNSYEIDVVRDNRGKTIGLSVNNARIKNVAFTKR